MTGSIPSPTQSDFGVGPLEFHVYGLSYAVAIFVAGWITVRRWEARGGDRDTVFDVLIWAIPAGLIGARIYFVLTSSDEVGSEWWAPFAVWEGGLGSWGGFSAGVLVAVWRLRRAGASVADALDAAAPALLVAHAIGRVGGNYVNQELFGKPSDLPWAVEISPDNRPSGYEQYETFHPTFFYEALWDLALAGFLVWLERHREVRPPGLFALYVTGYCAFRIFEELLRVDPSHYVLGLRLNFFVSCVGAIAGFLWFAWIQGWWGRNRMPSAGDSRAQRAEAPKTPG